MRKSKGEREFKWSDNSPYDYKYWLSLRYEATRYTEDKCVTQEFSSKVDGKWKFGNCNATHPYTCKITRNYDKTHLSFIGNCTEGWTKVKDKCYKLFNTFITWAAAREKCKGYGGNLVTITSEEMQRKLIYMSREVWRAVWIGVLLVNSSKWILNLAKLTFDSHLSHE